ncbi:predicted protein [Lichtheimia corymbifera JMRC:FSU:9682]|uniref:Uncharacterized protein n=1 Tax=Lichtheimia corymbifera JMRC:FSU:9682 TaxID=1263082 RepID=A0A068SC66_9FUNG|nr:predicted protein [Lichtheimia corymbifera JMRC:FSU:9682]
MMMIHQERPHYFPKLLLCLCVVLLLGTLIPSVDAVRVETVKSEQEAKTVCNENEEAYERVIPLYQNKNDKDVFYSCEYPKKEHPSEFDRSKPCDPKEFGPYKKKGPVQNIYYQCDNNGKLQLLLCTGIEGKGCSYPLAPTPPTPERHPMDDGLWGR